MPNAGHSQTNSSGPAGGSGHVHHRETNECGPPPPANGYRTGPAGSGAPVTKASKTPVACRPVGTLVPSRWLACWPDAYVFVAGEVLLDLSFPAAAARLADLAHGGSLTHASQEAYDDGLTGLVRVGPPGAAADMSKLVEAHVLDVATRGESAVLALRWETTGPGGRLFPALDADMSLTPRRAAFHPAIAGRGLPASVRCPGRGAWTGGRSRGGRRDGTVPAGPASRTFSPPPEPASALPRTGMTGAAARRTAAECPGPAALRTADQAGGDRTRRS